MYWVAGQKGEGGHSGFPVQRTPVPTNFLGKEKNVPVSIRAVVRGTGAAARTSKVLLQTGKRVTMCPLPCWGRVVRTPPGGCSKGEP